MPHPEQEIYRFEVYPVPWSFQMEHQYHTHKIQKRVSEPGKKGRTLEVTLPKTNMINWKKQSFEDVSAMKHMCFFLPCEFFGRVNFLHFPFNWISSPEFWVQLIWKPSGKTPTSWDVISTSPAKSRDSRQTGQFHRFCGTVPDSKNQRSKWPKNRVGCFRVLGQK